MVKLLVLDYNADVNAKDKGGNTPLHVASESGDAEMVRLLVEDCKADILVQNGEGRKQYIRGFPSGCPERPRRLLANPTQVTAKAPSK